MIVENEAHLAELHHMGMIQHPVVSNLSPHELVDLHYAEADGLSDDKFRVKSVNIDRTSVSSHRCSPFYELYGDSFEDTVRRVRRVRALLRGKRKPFQQRPGTPSAASSSDLVINTSRLLLVAHLDESVCASSEVPNLRGWSSMQGGSSFNSCRDA